MSIQYSLWLVHYYSLYAYINYYTIIDATVSFEQQTYTVEEAEEMVVLTLVLSNPSSTDISIEVLSIDGSTTGKQLTIPCTIIE